MAEIQLGNMIDGPGTHALVIGVSRYPFADGPLQTSLGRDFGLLNLDAAARSAAEIARWLIEEHRNPAAPLASLSVLLSPAEHEVIPAAVAAKLTAPYGATTDAVRDAVQALRIRCKDHPENMAFVYVAGHGVQLTSLGATVLLEDFAGPGQTTMLEAAIDMRSCHASFNGHGYAAHQAWFVDSCRQTPAVAAMFERLSGGVPFDEPIGDIDSSPLYLASSSREEAFAEIGGMTLFSRALLAALRGDAADGPDDLSDDWHVAPSRLGDVLHRGVRALARQNARDQRVDVTGRMAPAVVQTFEHPPEVDLRVDLHPVDAAQHCKASLYFGGSDLVVSEVAEWPLERRVPAGNYTLVVDSDAPYRPIPHEPKFVRPRTFLWPVSVT